MKKLRKSSQKSSEVKTLFNGHPYKVSAIQISNNSPLFISTIHLPDDGRLLGVEPKLLPKYQKLLLKFLDIFV